MKQKEEEKKIDLCVVHIVVGLLRAKIKLQTEDGVDMSQSNKLNKDFQFSYIFYFSK